MNQSAREGDTIEGTATTVKDRPAKVKASKQVASVPAVQESKAISTQNPNPMTMIQMAIEKGTSIEQLEKLMGLQERWEANEARKAFVKALNAFKMNPPTIFKNKDVAFNTTAYSHATLDNVCDKIGAELSKHGLSHRWDIEQSGDKGAVIKVTCVLTHEMGHSERTPLSSLPDSSGGKNAIQSVGSAVTYLQRYTLLAATGMATKEGDDDGKGSDTKLPETAPAAKPEATAPKITMYPEATFNANIGNWKALVATGGKDPEKLIAQVETKGKLTDAQKKEIRDAQFPDVVR